MPLSWAVRISRCRPGAGLGQLWAQGQVWFLSASVVGVLLELVFVLSIVAFARRQQNGVVTA